MKLSVYNPKRTAFPSFPSLLDDFFSDSFFKPETKELTTRINPSVNVLEDENDYEIELLAPGMKKEDFSLEVDENQLTVKGEAKEDNKKEEKNFTRREFWKGSFEKVFTLPENVNAENIEAKYNNGILRVTLPKMEEKKNKTKVVKVA